MPNPETPPAYEEPKPLVLLPNESCVGVCEGVGRWFEKGLDESPAL